MQSAYIGKLMELAELFLDKVLVEFDETPVFLYVRIRVVTLLR